jgi:sensor histidine kinase YesM
MASWYLWAALFPFIFAITGKLRFDRENRFKNILFSVLIGTLIASFHAITQMLVAGGHSTGIIFNDALIATCLARFFNYSTILTVCIALHFYRHARKIEIQSAQTQNGILRAQFESLKIRLDPDYLFTSLDKINKMIRLDLDEADSMIARLGDYLRIRIETPLVFENSTSVDNAVAEPEFNSEALDIDPKDSSNPVRKWLLILAIFTFLPVYFAIQNMMLEASRGRTLDWSSQLLMSTGWYVWALFTPAILTLSARYPLQKRRFLKHLLIHFCGFATTWFFANLAYAAVKWGSNLGQYPYFSQLTLARTFGLDIICYSTIVAVESAIRENRRFESARLRTVQLNGELARARLQALRMQLHPHFLFNALNSLSQLMREEAGSAEEMIVNLKKFLRLTLTSSEAHEISLEKELEFLKCYLAIENIRFQDRLRIKMEIDPQTLEVAVPNLILQPIVENAIKHGVAPSMSPGEVEIRASRVNGMLKISVHDDGPGLSQRNKRDSRTGLGLSNTRERLIQLYGNSHRFQLLNAPEGGLLVTVEIPAAKNNHGEKNDHGLRR